MENGLIHLYTGDGKGKTTAAMGLAVRCAGHSGRVLGFQFMKDNSSGERNIFDGIENITFLKGRQEVKFSFAMNDDEKSEAARYYSEKFNEIRSEVCENDYDLLILDEVISAVNAGFLDKKELMGFLEAKPKGLEVVLTGRNADAELINIADYVTEMKCVRHPYEKGICARELIEY